MSFEYPEPTILSDATSEDGRTRSIEVVAGTFGVHDPEKQLTDEEIVKLKDTLKADPGPNGPLIARVSTHIVIKMLTADRYEELSEEELAAARAEGEEPEPLIGEDGRYENANEFAHHVGLLAVHWALGLKQAVDLPGAEWVKGMTPPATFSEALKEIEGLDYLGREVVDG